MRLHHLRGRRLLVVEIGNLTVTLRVVVERVDHDFSGERRDRYVAQVLQRDGDDDDVAGPGGFFGRRRARVRTELANKVGERLRTARIADDNVVTVLHRQPRELTANVSGAD